ncbi:MAG: hypothetical protein BGO57_03305 [Sphingomonadales bacterium 63-6]|nr:MAG: hypothetical protein BGO57_03305 [Sphingomonadales bacterium 63-6]
MKYLFLAAALAGAFAQPAFAQEEEGKNDKAGFRIEVRATLETPTVSSVEEEGDIYKLGSAMAFGGEAGFDFAVSDKVVVGPYGTYEISTVKNCVGADCLKATDNYAFGLHAGVTVGDRGLVYAKVGYASLGLEVSTPGLTVSERGGGVEGAIGYEHGFGSNFYGRVEFGYADNGDIFGINFQRRRAGLSLGARF